MTTMYVQAMVQDLLDESDQEHITCLLTKLTHCMIERGLPQDPAVVAAAHMLAHYLTEFAEHEAQRCGVKCTQEPLQ